MKTRTITDSERKDGFPMFGGFEFVKGCNHVVFEIPGAMAYAWNLDSVAEANTTDCIEICLFETHIKQRGKGRARKLLNELKKRYSHITIYGSENDGFWFHAGFKDSDMVSEVDGISGLLEWKR